MPRPYVSLGREIYTSQGRETAGHYKYASLPWRVIRLAEENK